MSKITPQDFLSKSKQTPIIDVRSPGEFDQGHIPGAINIPLFTNEERAIIGTIYKHGGQDKAIEQGFSYAEEKLPGLLSAFEPFRNKNIADKNLHFYIYFEKKLEIRE